MKCAGRLLVVLVFALPSSLPAQRIILRPVADTTLSEAAPDFNFGAETNVTSGTSSTGQRNRALLKFDIAGNVPWNAVIQRVDLSVSVASASQVQADYDLHRVLRDWREGAGRGAGAGEPAESGEVTWRARSFPDLSWTSPGGGAGSDFAEAATATAPVYDLGVTEVQSDQFPSLIDDVQNWLTNASANFGWVFKCRDENIPDTARAFGPSQISDTGFELVVEYGPPQLPRLSLASIADTTLFEYAPDNNLGAATLAAGTINQASIKRSRALLRFPIESIPSNYVLRSASLKLTVTGVPSGGGNGGNFDLHRVLQPWVEGNKAGSRGSPATAGETTWNARIFPSIPWSSPGAAAPSDFLTTATSTCQTSGVGGYTFTNLLQDVEFWRADPGANFGWILISQDEGTRATARRFASRENGPPPPGPELVLEYVPHPEIDRVELSNQEFRLYFQAYPGQDYTVETSESIHSANWTTLTNIAPFSALRTIAITNSASGLQRFYRLRI
jgi:hypothetical protein